MAEVTIKPCGSLLLINIVWASDGTLGPRRHDNRQATRPSIPSASRFPRNITCEAAATAAIKCILNRAEIPARQLRAVNAIRSRRA
jgi:hypothetical protein